MSFFGGYRSVQHRRHRLVQLSGQRGRILRRETQPMTPTLPPTD